MTYVKTTNFRTATARYRDGKFPISYRYILLTFTFHTYSYYEVQCLRCSNTKSVLNAASILQCNHQHFQSNILQLLERLQLSAPQSSVLWINAYRDFLPFHPTPLISFGHLSLSMVKLTFNWCLPLLPPTNQKKWRRGKSGTGRKNKFVCFTFTLK